MHRRIINMWLGLLIIIMVVFGIVFKVEADDKTKKAEDILIVKFDDTFKGKGSWSASIASGQGECSFGLSNEQARDENKYSGRFSYKFADVLAGGICNISITFTVPGMPLKIGLWIYGEDKEEYLAIRYSDSTGEGFQIPVGLAPLKFKGWKYVEFDLPGERFAGTGNDDGVVDYPITITNIMPWAVKGEGMFWIDSLWCISNNQ